MTKLKQWWSRLKPEQKRKVSIVSFALAVTVFSAFAYDIKSSKKPKVAKARTVEEIKLDEDLIEKGLIAKAQAAQAAQDNQLKRQQLEIERQQKALESMQDAIEELKNQSYLPQGSEIKKIKRAGKKSDDGPANSAKKLYRKAKNSAGITRLPPPPVARPENLQNYLGPNGSVPPPPPAGEKFKMILVGGISVESNNEIIKDRRSDTDSKKKVETIYLPPSFMEASLLSGVVAPTTSGAKNDPIPLIFRVNELAILPNRVKGNLKGCFVIGEGMGKLSDERVHVRLNTLSCVAKNGAAVIDQSIKGWVVDADDGKVGLKGNIVAKMGVHIARSALAGFIEGIGEGVKLSTQDTSFNALGNKQYIISETDTTNIARAGIGSGIATAANEIQKFYLELAEQTLPVVEVGATKQLTIVISEGVGLQIKEQRVGS